MHLEFVNHASLIYEHEDIRLICDPWLEGTVFDGSWSHVSQSAFSYDDYKSISHIWFSHEHPDHFFPPNIKKIPEEYRRDITVLFKSTIDQKVVNYCRHLKFKDVVELEPGVAHELADDFSVVCQPFHDDSALIVFADGQTVMNVNDCVLDSEEKLQKMANLANGTVDVLLTQFSYANYVGESYAERRKHAEKKLREMSSQIDFFAPKFVIPFASFVYFCHEENFHMNDAINRIDAVHDHFRNMEGTQLIVLYPGDRWSVGTKHNSDDAISRYVADHDAISGPLVRTSPLEPEALHASAQEFHDRLATKVDYIQFLRTFRVIKPLRIYVTDLQRAYELSLDSFEELSSSTKQDCGIAMSSQTLSFCMKFDYGWNTTAVNGKFEILAPQALRSFQALTSLGDAMNHGRVTWGELRKGIQRRLKRGLKRPQQAA